MSEIHNTGPIHNQVNNPIIQGNLVMYGERKVNRVLTAVPSLSDPIIGRKEALENLATTLTSAQRVVLVNGMGGIGKTTMATAYAQQNQAQFKHIAWIEQAGDFATDLAANTLLADNLGVQLMNNPKADAKAILNALSNLAGPSLLVIDNADQKLAPFSDYLPKAPQWQVLITSREELDFAKILALDFLNEQAAIELFYTHYKHDRNDKVLVEVIKVIDYHTLTIELLAKICQECRIGSLAEIQGILNKRGLAINRRANIRSAHNKSERIERLLPYLQAIFDIGDNINENQRQLLIQFVGLPPTDLPFPHLREILLGEGPEEKDIDDLQFDLRGLTRKGFVSYNEVTDAFKMHRVIQQVIQTKYEVNLQQLDKLVDGVGDFLTMRKGDKPHSRFDLLPYGQYILDNFSSYEDKKGRIAEIKHTMAFLLSQSHFYEAAEELLNEAIESNKILFSEDDVRVAYNQSALAQMYVSLGRLQEAYDLIISANDIFLKASSDKYCGQVSFNLMKAGEIFSHSDKEVSNRFFDLGIRMAEEILGPDDPSVEMYKMIKSMNIEEKDLE